MNICAYWNCQRKIAEHVFLCVGHYWSFKDGFINQCPKCGRFKNATYDLCLDCFYERKVTKWKPSPVFFDDIKKYEVEHSDKWKKHKKTEGPFFAYILKLANGRFRAGHTNNLRARLSEHRDNTTKDTAGLQPRLQYFEILATRDKAKQREVELKKLCDSNPRKIRSMIIEFGDYISELKFD